MSRTYRWKLALSAILFGGIAVFSTQGCTVTTSNDPIDGGDWEPWDGRDAGNGNFRATCEGCAFDWCRQQWAVCQDDTNCHNIYTCSLACDKFNDPTQYNQCTQSCYDQYPAGKTNYRNLAVCNQYYSCANTCKSLCNDTADYCNAPAPTVDAGTTPPPPPAPQTCFDCTTANCRTEKTRCSPGSECEAYSACTNACASATVTDPFQCVDDCGLARPQGKNDSEALSSCTTNRCRTECGL
ncbi:hypothetical protein LZC95_18705 [Pendulispora brunnea]|uniref:Uncharacterized protein n=1 Tax=Pendulispora brunnea TaxID=2905690 RepID=A0ABZ2KNC3_9BACT